MLRATLARTRPAGSVARAAARRCCVQVPSQAAASRGMSGLPVHPMDPSHVANAPVGASAWPLGAPAAARS